MHHKEEVLMKKQTVLERYEQEQMKKGEGGGKPISKSQSGGNQQLSKIFQQMEEALLQAHQSVRQAQLADPTQLFLQQADQRLQHASQQLQQLKTATPELTLGLSKASQQQFTQLDHQIQQASGTLQLMMTSLNE